jgi:hypothetical protein
VFLSSKRYVVENACVSFGSATAQSALSKSPNFVRPIAQAVVKVSNKFVVGTAALRTRQNGDARALASNALAVLQSWPEILKAKNRSCKGYSAAHKSIPPVLMMHTCAGCVWFVQNSQSVIASPFLISCMSDSCREKPMRN